MVGTSTTTICTQLLEVAKVISKQNRIVRANVRTISGGATCFRPITGKISREVRPCNSAEGRVYSHAFLNVPYRIVITLTKKRAFYRIDGVLK